jgi:uroporphyrinogen decarboxylase
MRPRDRVLTALHHEKPDRCPMQISVTPEFAVRLREELRTTGKSVHNPHRGRNTYELEHALREAADVCGLGQLILR